MPSQSRQTIPIILSPPIPDVLAYVYNIYIKKCPKKMGKKISLYKVKNDTATKNIRITMIMVVAWRGWEKKRQMKLMKGKHSLSG